MLSGILHRTGVRFLRYDHTDRNLASPSLKYTLKRSVHGCKDCPFATNDSDGRVTLKVCSHPTAPKGYESIREEGLSVQAWCPLLQEDYTITLDLN